MHSLTRPSLVFLGLLLGACGNADHDTPDPSTPAATPAVNLDTTANVQCSDKIAQKRAYFGDLHTHTSYSLDAYAIGNRSDPAKAYAFARGAPVTIAEAATKTEDDEYKKPATIDRPLDFLAVTDHSEFLSTDYGCTVDASSPYYNSTYCADTRNQGSLQQTAVLGQTGAQLLRPNPTTAPICGTDLDGNMQEDCLQESTRAWTSHVAATNSANDPCHFTSLIAYEWTATTGQNNLHRNVIFGSSTVPAVPADYIHYPQASQLWAQLDQTCTGDCKALTIPHNSNASGGQMFAFNSGDVAAMAKYQTLVEMYQHKGASECLYDPADSAPDTNCNFELLGGAQDSASKPGYVRYALQSGLSYYNTNRTQPNPLQLGFVGATDNHNSTPGNVKEGAEDASGQVTYNWPGHLGLTDNSPQERVSDTNADFSPGSITGVWSEQNTRESIFAALQRRETFATSGPRIQVRFYQYWDPTGTRNPCTDTAFFQQLMEGQTGSTMGGTIKTGVGKPSFVVYATKDAIDLAEIDFFKAAVSPTGIVQTLTPVPPVKWKVNSSGVGCAIWKDDSFDRTVPSFYYSRVLEQKTNRWSHYDCTALKNKYPDTWKKDYPRCTAASTSPLDIQIQERAWTSPIWNLP